MGSERKGIPDGGHREGTAWDKGGCPGVQDAFREKCVCSSRTGLLVGFFFFSPHNRFPHCQRAPSPRPLSLAQELGN